VAFVGKVQKILHSCKKLVFAEVDEKKESKNINSKKVK
jgi:hypothetical protein